MTKNNCSSQFSSHLYLTCTDGHIIRLYISIYLYTYLVVVNPSSYNFVSSNRLEPSFFAVRLWPSQSLNKSQPPLPHRPSSCKKNTMSAFNIDGKRLSIRTYPDHPDPELATSQQHDSQVQRLQREEQREGISPELV